MINDISLLEFVSTKADDDQPFVVADIKLRKFERRTFRKKNYKQVSFWFV